MYPNIENGRKPDAVPYIIERRFARILSSTFATFGVRGFITAFPSLLLPAFLNASSRTPSSKIKPK